MKFVLDYTVSTDDAELDSATLQAAADEHRDLLATPADIDGRLVLTFDGKPAALEFDEPLIRLVANWIRKATWALGGDTETLALRNSEEYFGFMPSGNSIEISFFEGTEEEVEDYILEPAKVPTPTFITEAIRIGDTLFAQVSAACSDSDDEELEDLKIALDEAKHAWHQQELRKRR